MPVGGQHDLTDLRDVVVGNLIVEQVAHGVDENLLWLRPAQRIRQVFRHQAKVEALLISMAGNSPPSLGEGFGVAVLQPGLILSQPRTGFQVALVHSISDVMLMMFSLVGVVSGVARNGFVDLTGYLTKTSSHESSLGRQGVAERAQGDRDAEVANGGVRVDLDG